MMRIKLVGIFYFIPDISKNFPTNTGLILEISKNFPTNTGLILEISEIIWDFLFYS